MKKKADVEEKAIGVVPLLGCRCRCGHEWLPHGNNEPGGFERPRVCPKCKSANWDQPKRWENKKPSA
jgi:hypothetical protein